MHVVVKVDLTFLNVTVSKNALVTRVFTRIMLICVGSTLFYSYKEKIIVLTVKCHEWDCLEELSSFTEYGKRLSRLISFFLPKNSL